MGGLSEIVRIMLEGNTPYQRDPNIFTLYGITHVIYYAGDRGAERSLLPIRPHRASAQRGMIFLIVIPCRCVRTFYEVVELTLWGLVSAIIST